MASGKGNLYISADIEPLYMAHHLTTYFESVIKPLADFVGGNFLDEQEYGGLLCGFLSLRQLTVEQFNRAYQLTINACQNDENLSLYQADFERLFKSDPRFQVKALTKSEIESLRQSKINAYQQMMAM